MTDLNHLPNEKELIDFYLKRIAVYLDKHPDLQLTSYVHMVDGQWKHEVGIKKKP